MIPIDRAKTYSWGLYTKRTNAVLAGNSVLLVLVEYDRTFAATGTTITLATIVPGTTWAETTGTVGAATFNAATAYVQVLIRDNSSATGAVNLIDGVAFYL